MREFRPLTDEELERAYHTIYTAAFPPQELKPLWAMSQGSDGGRYITLGYFEENVLLGCASLWSADGGYILLDYLAVPEERRCCGCGSALLRALPERYPPGTVFMIESEAPTGRPEADALILRRLDFYRRCGARPLHFDTGVFGVHYKILALCAGMPDEAELLHQYTALYRRHFPDALWEKAFRIPLRAGEALPVFEEWLEEDEKL